MCQPGSSRNNRPTHRGWLGGEVACSEINSTLRCGSDGNCAFERAARASIAHAVSNTILRPRQRTIVTWTAPTAFGRRISSFESRMESVSGVGMALFCSVSLILVLWHEISGFDSGLVE